MRGSLKFNYEDLPNCEYRNSISIIPPSEGRRGPPGYYPATHVDPATPLDCYLIYQQGDSTYKYKINLSNGRSGSGTAPSRNM